MIEVYKILTGIYDTDVANFLPLHRDHVVNPERTRGHKLKLFQTRHRLNLRKNFFTVKVASIWNSLPSSVIEAPSVNSFENRLDKAWKKQQIKYDHKKSLNLKRSSHIERNNNEQDDMRLEALFA